MHKVAIFRKKTVNNKSFHSPQNGKSIQLKQSEPKLFISNEISDNEAIFVLDFLFTKNSSVFRVFLRLNDKTGNGHVHGPWVK